MRLSLSEDDGELIELGEETKAAHLLVKAIKRKQVINSLTRLSRNTVTF